MFLITEGCDMLARAHAKTGRLNRTEPKNLPNRPKNDGSRDDDDTTRTTAAAGQAARARAHLPSP
eukprot:4164236-Prymnesium_polylepis.1